MTEANGDAGTGSTEPQKEKKEIRRKPLWLVLPVEFENIVDEAGEIVVTPIRYEVYECAGKGEVAKILAKLRFDPTNAKHVKLFRADPIPMSFEAQVQLKF
jgi:hypothetical protein